MEPTREQLAQALSDTAMLLYELWRCSDDAERAKLGERVATATTRYAVHPSYILAGVDARTGAALTEGAE